jgi:hypothetical protein
MAKISTYPILSNPTTNDILIGTDVEDLNITKNFSIGSIIGIIGNQFVPYVGATGNVNLGAFNITASSFIVAGGTANQFLKADGTLDSTVYVPSTRTLTINSVTFDLSANRSWDLNTINSLTTTGTSGPATYIGKTLNIPQYQAQGNYITQLSGEATAMGPGNATVTLSNLAVISKILTGLNITGGTIIDTDSILTAFGKVQNQLNGLTGGVTYQGTWNAATNTPTLTSSVGTKGYYYVVNVAGSTNLNGITDWKLGDWAIFNGSTWEKVDNTDAVVSVNGYTGAVVLTFSDVGAPPATRNLTINGVQFDLTADRTWTVGDVRTDQSYANPTWITSLAWTKITGTPTTLAGYGITDGVSSSRTLTINGVTYDLTADRSWSVGTVTSVGTSGPLTGGTITGSGTIGITQSGSSSDGYLSSTDWNTFNNKQNALTNPVTGTGTIFTLPMWSGATSLVDSPLSYGPDTFNFQYNSATGGTVNFTNIGLTAYTYSIQMNNFGSPRSTVHSYTDGVVVQSIASTQVSRLFANGNFILGDGAVDNGHKLSVEGNVYIETIANATVDTDKFIVSDGGIIKYRTGAELLSDIGAQGALTLTTTGTSGAATLIGNVLNIPQYTDQFVGTVTSVGLSMPAAFTVSNSPVTSAGTLTVVGAGLASQYVRGDGTLGDFPGGGGGGGSSVSYYLNGSINQGTFAGNTYYEMSKVPVFGAGTDFNIATNGYVAQFITDANDPESLLIPAGNWNFELYFSASSSGGTPSFYVELYKYDGATFTLIADNSANPEFIAFGTTINPYFSPLAVPETVLAVTDRLAIRVYVNNSGKTITLHTENSHLCQVITTFTTGLTALNGLTKQVQYLTTGTSGTDFNIASSVATHTFNLPTATSTIRGALSSADWITFNGKQNAITLTTTGTSGPATFIANTLNIPNYTTDLSGYVTLNTSQTITASKSFTAGLILASEGSGNQNTVFRNTASIHSGSGGSNIFGFNNSNNIYFGKGLSNGGVLQWSNSAVRYYTLQDGDGTLAFLSDIPSLAGYVTLATDQTITGLKTIMRVGAAIDVLNFKIDTSNIYALKVAYNQNELSPSGEATWSLVNTFNNGSGTGLTTTPISFFRGVLVTGERLLSASVNSNLLDYYGNNPSGRYPIYAYNTGVQQFASSIIVGETTGVVNAVTGVISDLPAGVVANFKGRVIGSDAVNNNEFVTLSQATSTSRAAISLTTTGSSGPATYNNVTGVLNIPEYAGTVNPSAREIQTYIATASQTTFTVTGGYTVGLVDVFINGVRLTSSDYTATNGTTVVLAVGTMAGNIVDIIKYTSGIVNSISGSGTTNELAYFTASTTIASLSTATYPSLTELSYVKGVTSSIQTQLNGKQNALTNPVTGTGTTNTLPKFTGSTTIGNSLFTDDGTNGAFGGANYGSGTDLRSFNISAPLYPGLVFWANNVRTGDIFGYSVTGNLLINADPTNVFSGTKIGMSIDGTERFAIFSNGNVTIANSPTDAGFKLDVNGTGRFSGTITTNANEGFIIAPSSGASYMNYRIGGTSYSLIGVAGTTSDIIAGSALGDLNIRATNSQKILFSTNNGGSAAMTITSGGNVLIGTTTDDNKKLRVNGTISSLSQDAFFLNNLANTTDTKNWSIQNLDTSGQFRIRAGNDAQTDGQNALLISRSGISITNVTFPNGNVGIGTAIPDSNSRLDVNGQAFVAHLAIYNNNGTPSLGTSPMLYSPASGTLAFSTATAERMRITSGGNVLIGTTSNSGERLRVDGTIGVYGATIASGYSRAFYVRGSQNVADGATLTLSVTNTALVFIAENNTGTGALFFCGYASGTITKISDPSNIFDTADTAGKLCIFKNAVTDVTTIKNRLGGSRNITVSYIGVSD